MNIPSGQHYKVNNTNLAYGDVGAAASSHQHGGGDITSQVSDANTVDGSHASAFAASSHAHAGGDITSGSLDGDRLAAPTTTKRGGVKETGTPSGKFLRDDDSWATAGGAYRRPATIVVAASDSKDTTNADYICPATDALDYITTTVIPALPAGGGKILLLEGNYTVDTDAKPLLLASLTKPIEIAGCGDATILKHGTASKESHVIYVTGTSGPLVIHDLKISMTGATGNCDGIFHADETGGGTIEVYGCSIAGRRTAIHLYSHSGNWIHDNKALSSVTASPIYAEDASYVRIMNNGAITAPSGSYGINCPSCGPGMVIGENRITTGGIYVTISGWYWGLVYENIIVEPHGHGIMASACTVAANRIDFAYSNGINVASDCMVFGNAMRTPNYARGGYAAISVTGARNLLTQNNVMAEDATYYTYGIEFGGSSSDNAASDNKFSSFGTAAILDGGTRNIWSEADRTFMTDVLAEDPDAIVDNEDLNVSLPLTCTLDGQPDYGRNVTLLLTDADDSISAINITVTGITAAGLVMTETFTFASFTAKVATGLYPFEKITEVKVNSGTGIGVGDVLDAGTGKKIGLPGRISAAGDVIWVKQNAAKTTAYTANAVYGTIAPTTLTAADDFDVLWRRNSNYWMV
jgi:hypothetical protein